MEIPRRLNGVAVLDVVWRGPRSYEEMTSEDEVKSPQNYGIYQYYGTHPVLGPDTLLYIGCSTEHGRTFGMRAKTGHKEWIDWESAPVCCYVGQLGGTSRLQPDDHVEWGRWISIVEHLLIYYCSPPYNSAGLRGLPANVEAQDIVVLNFKRRHRLPMVVSTLYERAPVHERMFQPYS